MVALETPGSLRRAIDEPLAAVMQGQSEHVVLFAGHGRSQYGGVGVVHRLVGSLCLIARESS